jgi:hypothetical protein
LNSLSQDEAQIIVQYFNLQIVITPELDPVDERLVVSDEWLINSYLKGSVIE